MTEAGSSNSSYSGVAKAFHWIIVVLIAAMLYGAWTIDSVPKPDRLAVMQKHAGIGIIILILVILALTGRL